MADPQLLQYIIAQEHSGYTEQQIRAALLQNGYQQVQVDEAFKELTHPSDVDPQIHEYVTQYARQGMTPVQVFTTLTQQGYAPNKVRKSVIEVFGKGTLPGQHHAFAFAIVAILVVAAGVYLILPTLQQGTTPVDSPTGKASGVNVLAISDQIAQVVALTQENGKTVGVKECDVRFVGDNRDTCYSAVALTEPSSSKYCDRIADTKIKDSCLWNFVDVERESVCQRVQLRENIDTCKSLAALQSTAKKV